MTLQWKSINPRTGAIHDDLPGLVPQYPLRRTICQYDTGTATLYLDKAPDNWEQATEPMGAVLAVFDDQDKDKHIQWAGLVTSRQRLTGTDTVTLSMMTAEGYLDRRKITADTVLTATAQGTIVSNLISAFVADSGGLHGLTVVWSGSPNTARDVNYLASDFASVYQRIIELAALDGGFEWTIDWEWGIGPGGEKILTPTLYMAGGRGLGSAPIAGLRPGARFSMPGCLTDAQISEDCSDGKYASTVRAYSSGQGATTPASTLHTAATNKLTADYAWQPEANVLGDAPGLAKLDAYAQKAVQFLSPGSSIATVTASLGAKGTPLVGREWVLGDDVLVTIGSRDADGRPIKAFPNGYKAIARAIAYEITDTTLTPILAVPTLEDIA